jgi:uncharacterized protein Yka (UPF0111/DUF47 family)
MTTTTITAVPEAPISLWSDLKTTVRSVFGAIVAAARTTEKAVTLVENEVDNLNEMQEIRLDLTKSEREQQRLQIEAMLRSRTRASKK